MKDRPIMANIVDVEDENGNMVKDFSGHSMYYDEEKNKTVYVEIPVGHVINPENIRVEYDEQYQRDFALADCVIYEEYTDTCDILRRRGKVDCSVELCVREMSFDSSTKELRLDDYYVQGITLLGESVLPGMKGSNVTLKDFSMENNSIYFDKTQLINEVTNAVIKQLSDIEAFAKNSKEGGKPKEMDKFNELLAKYNKTVDDITFDYNDMSDEELEVAFANAFETADESENSSSKENESSNEEETPVVETEASKEEVTEETAETPEVVDDFADDDPAADGVSDEEGGTDPAVDPTDDPTEEPAEEPSDDEEHQTVSAIKDEDSTGTRVENSLNYSVTIDGVKKDFAVSLADKINALTTLVNDTYSESDNTYYYVDVFEEDRYVVIHDFWNDRHFRQEFSVKKDVYSLKGDRVPVFAQYLTSDEIAKLDKMKSDFSSIESELNSYKEKELHAQREAILNSEDYSVMVDFAEFNELKSHMDEYSVEELTNKADLIYAKFMKSNYSSFAATKPQKKASVLFMTSGDNKEEERLPYGGLFKNFKNRK